MKRKWPNRLCLAGAFAIPAAVMFALFIANSIFPFGDRSFLFSDMYHQYMPFFTEFVEKVRSGESLAYSWKVGVGSNFLALYVYYLASPFHWLAFLVPRSFLMEFMSYLVIFKIGLCGLTCCLYLRRHFASESPAAVLFACFYALSGFLAAYNWNIMWLDCVVLLPLIVLGLECLVKEGKCTLYCVTLALSICTNYYLSIMICIYLVLYFLVLLFSERGDMQTVLRFLFYSVLAGGMAAILLVPEVYAILVTDFGYSYLPTKLESYFPILDELARHCMGVFTERGLEHWPNIYCGTPVFLLIPLFAVNPGIPMRRRFGGLLLAGIFLASFSTNILDVLWHGMNYPDSLPARQSYIYILLVLTMCCDSFLHIRELEKRQILTGYLAGTGFLLFCEKFVDNEDFSPGLVLGNVVFVTLYAILLYFYRTRSSREWRRALGGAALLLAVLELAINTAVTSVGTTGRAAYLDELPNYAELYAQAQQRQEGFFRVEKFARKTKNDGTLAGYPTASLFSSTMNSSVADLYERLGMRHSKVYYCYDGATGLTSALLNVNYLFEEVSGKEDPPSQENGLYTLVDTRGNVRLYECSYTLPFGYVAPAGFDLPEGYQNSPFRLQNELVEGLGVESALFRKVQCSQDGDDVKLTAGADGYYYMLVSQSGTAKIDADGSFGTRSYTDLKVGSILYVGYLKGGQQVRFTNADDGDDTRKIQLEAYTMDEKTLAQAVERLSRQHLREVSYDSSHIQGRLTLDEAGRLILSVPYEMGWQVLVNGQRREPALFGECFMALDLEPGEYEISLSYRPYGQQAGVWISVLSVLVFAGVGILPRLKKRKVRENKEENQ